MIDRIERNKLLLEEYTRRYDTALCGGKHLRGCLTLLVQESILGSNTIECFKVASAIDLIHNTSLLVDDFIDDDKTRRGKAAFHVDKKKKEIILRVVYELSFPYYIINTEVSDYKARYMILNRLVETQAIMSDGVLNEIKNTLPHILHPSEIYLNLLSKKTGSLFGLAAYVGAALSYLDEDDCGLFYDLGREMGIMYQIIDDILDVEDVLCGKKLPGTEILLLRAAGVGTMVEELISDIKNNTISCKKIKLLINDKGLLKQLEKIRYEQQSRIEKAFNKIPEKYANNDLLRYSKYMCDSLRQESHS